MTRRELGAAPSGSTDTARKTDVDAVKTANYYYSLVQAGAATVKTNTIPPGVRIARACTLTEVHVVVGTAPTGAALIVQLRINGTIYAAGQASVAAAATTANVTGLTQALSAGDLVTFDITQIGSTVAGSDVAVGLLTA